MSNVLAELGTVRGRLKNRAEFDGFCGKIGALLYSAIQAKVSEELLRDIVKFNAVALSSDYFVERDYDLWMEYMNSFVKVCTGEKLRELLLEMSREESAQVGVTAAVLVDVEK